MTRAFTPIPVTSPRPRSGAIAAAKSLRDYLTQRGITPRRRFGQNFLHEARVARRIAEAVEAAPGEHVLEIGPGLGALTVPLLGVLAVLVLPLGTPIALRMKADSIRRRFEDQLTDTLQLLASSLRAGNSLLKALDTVAEEAAQPTAKEFVRAVNEVRVGSDLGDALDNIAQRMHSTDFEWVSQAVDIHREVGGNLAEVLDQVSETLRDRNQMRRQIQSLSADGRLSAWVLMALPLVVPLLLTLINPGFLAPMISSPIGWVLLGVSAVLLLIGGLWIRRLVAMPL